MLRWVGQEEPFGCGCAVVAMVTGRTYGQIRAHIGRDLTSGSGLSGSDYEVLLAELGYATARIYRTRQLLHTNEERDPWPPAPFAAAHLCEVLCHGAARGSHMVVMLADGTVLDPLGPEPRRLADYAAVYWVAAVVPLCAEVRS